MNEVLFQVVNQYECPIKTNESPFEFLQRGGRKKALKIRQWMEEWFREYPCEKKESLKHRLQSKKGSTRPYKDFLGAFFELQLHQILQRLNCVIEIEPDFPGTNGTVDFRAVNNAQRFHIEAIVHGLWQGPLTSTPNEDDAVQKLHVNLNHPHSDIWLESSGELHKTLASRHVVKPFRDLLNKYNPEEVIRIHSEYGLDYASHNLSANIQVDDWILKGFLVPPPVPGTAGQISLPARTAVVDVSEPLANALFDKAKDWKKKKLENEMFLITVNVCRPDFFWGDETTAIFGHRDLVEERTEFTSKLSTVNGIIVVGNAVLGNERNSPVRIYRNGNKCIPDCLEFLLQEKRFGDLLGIN